MEQFLQVKWGPLEGLELRSEYDGGMIAAVWRPVRRQLRKSQPDMLPWTMEAAAEAGRVGGILGTFGSSTGFPDGCEM